MQGELTKTSKENQIAVLKFQHKVRGDLIHRWNERAKLLGYEGINDLLSHLEDLKKKKLILKYWKKCLTQSGKMIRCTTLN